MEKKTEDKDKSREPMSFPDMLESIMDSINWKIVFEGEEKRIFTQEKTGYFIELNRNEAKMKVRSKFRLATPSTVHALTQALCEDVDRLFDVERFRQSREKIVGFQDCVFDLVSGKIRKYSNTDFVLNPLPHRLNFAEYDPEADRWFCGVLSEWVGGDVADWFCTVLAYFLFIHPNGEQIWLNLFGMGANGKSLCLKILEKILGPDKCIGCDLANINRFSSASYLGKWLVIGRDSSTFVSDAATALIKAFTGEDRGVIEKKGGNSFDDEISGKMIVSTNTLIQSKDRSFGWFRRILPVPFPNQFKTDPAFEKSVMIRLPDILRVLLHRAYCYTVNQTKLKAYLPGEVENLITETRYLNDRVAAYWDMEFFSTDKGKKTPNKEKMMLFKRINMRVVYNDYKAWHERFYGDGEAEPKERTFCGQTGAFMQHAKDFYTFKRTDEGSTVILNETKLIGG